MKPTVLSKDFIVVSFMAALSVAVIPNLTKTAQAQPQSPAAITAQRENCDRIMRELGEAMYGGYSYDDFQGLNLTDKQQKAYDALSEQADAKRAEVYERSISVADPNASLSFLPPPGISVPPDVQAAIQEALDSNPKIDQEAALNQKFGNGQYGLFIGSYITYITPEQQAQLDQITADFYSQVKSLITSEQQPQYRKNLEGRLKINAVCDQKAPFYGYPALGQIRDRLPAIR